MSISGGFYEVWNGDSTAVGSKNPTEKDLTKGGAIGSSRGILWHHPSPILDVNIGWQQLTAKSGNTNFVDDLPNRQEHHR